MGIREDYIDFPCSDTFRGFFYERGLTPHPPAPPVDKTAEALVRVLEDLSDAVREIRDALETTPVRSSSNDNSYSMPRTQYALPKPNQRRIAT